MDLALVSPTLIPDPASADSEIPRLLEKTLLDLGYGARLLTRTRVPIIRFCEQPTPELLEALLENRAKWVRVCELLRACPMVDGITDLGFLTGEGEGRSTETKEGKESAH